MCERCALYLSNAILETIDFRGRRRWWRFAFPQCDQIGRFIGLWATLQSLLHQLICPNLLHTWAIFEKVSKYVIFIVKTFLGNFYRHLATFYWSHCSPPPSVSLFLPFSLARPFAKYCYTRPTARWSILETAASQVSPISSHSLIPSFFWAAAATTTTTATQFNKLTYDYYNSTRYIPTSEEREREKSLKFRNKFT